MNMWYTSKVFKGDQTGRTINFPTVNLDPKILPNDFRQGIYASLVKYHDEIFRGALYFGPRLVLDETTNVLEIFILGFDKEIYNEAIEFQVKDFVREVQNFASVDEMKKTVEQDIEQVKNLLKDSV